MPSQLAERYRKHIAPTLLKELGYKNKLQAPRVTKIVVNMGVKEGASDIKFIDQAAQELAVITGQRPIVTRARKSIAGFKLRQGAPIGLKVTLRQRRMYEFMERLFNIAIPRIRDFRGYSPKGFDEQANFTLGIEEQIIFPEVDYDKIKKIQGMHVTFVTSTTKRNDAQQLLQHLGLPFRK